MHSCILIYTELYIQGFLLIQINLILINKSTYTFLYTPFLETINILKHTEMLHTEDI